MASGIKDKVVILGMGCSRFGERWDVGSDQLMLEAFREWLIDAGIERHQIGAVVGLLMSVLMIFAIAWRALDEERFLHKNLPSYAEYCQRVRYRLVPFVW
ncbi:MAG TPA: hypothetical protein VGL34_28850 [Steroidobacteraceae bacterium]